MNAELAAQTESLSSADRFLIARAEEAVRDGLPLRRWCLEEAGRLPWFPIHLKRQFALVNRAEGCFGSVEFAESRSDVMTCRQEIEFGSITVSNAAERLRDYVLGEFIQKSHWTYEDGNPGGLGVRQNLFRSPSGTYGRFQPDQSAGLVDWRQLGTEYDWVLFTVDVHDFVMDMGPWRKRVDAAAALVAHPSFVHVIERPSPDVELEVGIGYPFVRFAPKPNFFGFGPGKFQVAVKLFAFSLTNDRRLRARMTFAAAPRCAKVLDFGPGWPDPFYGGARLLEWLTLGRFRSERVHNFCDGEMLALHCRVHMALMDGAAKIWEALQSSAPQLSVAR